jgi:hypothetical protein
MKGFRYGIEHGPEVAALVFDGLAVVIAHLTDRLGQPDQIGNADTASVLLGEHLLELRICIHIGAGRALPAAAETRKPLAQVEKERLALLLAIVADVDADLALLRHHAAHRVPPKPRDLGWIDLVTASALRVEPRQLLRSRQAAGVSGENAVGAALHADR